MNYCKNCGAPLPAGAVCCPTCGTVPPQAFDNAQPICGPVPDENAAPLCPPEQAEQAAPNGPAARSAAPKGPFYTPSSAYRRPQPPRPRPGTQPGETGRVLSTADYFWNLVLFKIPLVGLIFMFIWGFGSGVPLARRNLARAYLLRTALVFLLVVFCLLLLGFLFFITAGSIQYYGFDPTPFGGHNGHFVW